MKSLFSSWLMCLLLWGLVGCSPENLVQEDPSEKPEYWGWGSLVPAGTSYTEGHPIYLLRKNGIPAQDGGTTTAGTWILVPPDRLREAQRILAEDALLRGYTFIIYRDDYLHSEDDSNLYPICLCENSGFDFSSERSVFVRGYVRDLEKKDPFGPLPFGLLFQENLERRTSGLKHFYEEDDFISHFQVRTCRFLCADLQWHIGYSVRVFVAKSDKDETPLEKGQCSFSEDDLCLLGWRVYWYETGQ